MIDENSPKPDEKTPASDTHHAASPSEAVEAVAEESLPEHAPAAVPAPSTNELMTAEAEAHEARVHPETLTEPQPSEPPAEMSEPAPPVHEEAEAAPAAPEAAHEITPETEPTAEHEPEPAAPTAAEHVAAPEAEEKTEETAEESTPEAKPKRTRKAKAASEATPAAAAAETPVDTTAEPAAVTETPANADATVGTEPTAEPVPESKKKWYAVKVQSGREESIKAAVERKVKIEGLEEFFGQIVIPVEEMIVKKKVKVKNKKTGETTTQEKNVSKYNKKFPGYLFAEVEFNDQILYVFRETSGVGDFVGITAKRKPGSWEPPTPTPMTDREVQSMLTGVPDPTRRKTGQPAKTVVKLDFEKGDKVRIRNGAFVGSEGEVKSITEPKDPTETPKVTVVVTFWGRPVDVEVDYWEVDKI